MADDPVPNGYVPMRLAFSRFRQELERKGSAELPSVCFIEFLMTGELTVYWRDPQAGQLAPIPHEYWQEANSLVESGTFVKSEGKILTSRTGYIYRILHGGALHEAMGPLSVYRERTPFIQCNQLSRVLHRPWSDAKPGTSGSERNCTRWLVDQMKKSPHQRPKSKAAYFNEAQKMHPVSKRGFDRAWNAATAEAGSSSWSRAGRPRKSPHTKSSQQ